MTRRQEFIKHMREAIGSGKIKVAEPGPDDVVVVTRAEGYDMDRDREVFLLEINQSKPRDLECKDCHHQVVMSNGMYSKLLAGIIRPGNILCSTCLIASLPEPAAT